MRKIPQRKDRKREKRSKDRRPKSKRRKDSAEVSQYYHSLALEIVKILPKKDMTFVNQKFFCVYCNMFYCVDFTGRSAYCHECHYKLGCLKLASGKQKLCDYCGRIVCQDTNNIFVKNAEAQA
jgi:hypothetical protein